MTSNNIHSDNKLFLTNNPAWVKYDSHQSPTEIDETITQHRLWWTAHVSARTSQTVYFPQTETQWKTNEQYLVNI